MSDCWGTVLFISKSFHGAELNWKTQDKECGAIYKALEKFQYLLYIRHFILETDNKKLTFLNTATSSRVYRWKLAIQRYAFNIRHVVGELNVVADTGNTNRNNVPNKRLLVGTFLCAVLGTLRSTFCVPDTFLDVPDIIWSILPNNIRHHIFLIYDL